MSPKNLTASFAVEVLSGDGTTLCGAVIVTALRPMRGSQDGLIWRGSFPVAACERRPYQGESLIVLLTDGRQVPAVLVDVNGTTASFRARGTAPWE